MLPPPPPSMKKLGSTNHEMLGAGMPVATHVRTVGLVSFTTKVSAVMSTSGGSEQGGEGDVCSQLPQNSMHTGQQQTEITRRLKQAPIATVYRCDK